MSASGQLAAATVLLIAASAVPAWRIPVGGAAVHPYLLPMGLLFVAVALVRLRDFPLAPLQALLAFTGCYLLSILLDGLDVTSILKITTSTATILAMAVAIRSFADLRACVSALVGAVFVMSVRGLLFAERTVMGINPLEEIANKNGFSLYALPALLIGGWFVLQRQTGPWVRRALMLGVGVIALTVFATANRSGWLGVGLVGCFLALMQGRGRAVVGLALFAVALYFAVDFAGFADVVEFRVKQTTNVDAYASDDIREQLFVEAMLISLEHPLFGAGPRTLTELLAFRVGLNQPAVDPHNVIGHLAGGTGWVTTLTGCAFFYLLVALPTRGKVGVAPRRLTISLLFLWVFRGLFTQDILFSPTFTVGIGLCIAYWRLEIASGRTVFVRVREQDLATHSRRSASPPSSLSYASPRGG